MYNQKKKTLLICCLLLIGRCSVIVAYSDEDQVRGDAYVDKLVRQLFVGSDEEYDVYRIDDSKIGFHKQIGFFNVSGEVKLYDGYIKSLRSLHRAGHCKLQEEGNRLNVAADLAAGVLDFHYSGTVKFMNWGPSVSIEGKLAYVEMYMKFSVDSKTGRDGELHKFAIDDMRGMNTKVIGLGPLNWALTPIVNEATKLFKRYLQSFLEKNVKNQLAKNIPNFQFPVEDPVTDTSTTVTGPPKRETEPLTEYPDTENPFEETEDPIDED